MIKKYLIILLMASTIWSCKKDKNVKPGPPVADVAALTSAKIETKHNNGITADVDLTIAGDSIIGVIPTIQPSKKLVITFATQTQGTVVKVADTLQISGTTITDFSKPVTYTLLSAQGKSKIYTVKIRNFTGLPILSLTTSGPVVSKDDYVTGTLTVNPNLDFPQDQLSIPLQIKGRGNSTWDFPKKPYRLKFTSKAAMLGLAAAKNWVLLANYDDKTLMRNRLALEMGRRLGADFTPPSRFVEVVMNGEFLGNYLLTTQVEVNENRVNITELKAGDSSPDKITGGYLLEFDQRLDADYWFKTGKDLPFTINEPEDITPAQLDYIHTYIQATEDAIFSTDFADPDKGYQKYINTDSFINWYLVAEVFKNQDAKDFSSIYYYKDRNGKLGMGPLWDFDISGGNVNYSDATSPLNWWVRDGAWFNRLHQDNNFKQKVKARWAVIKNTALKSLFTDIDANAAYLQLSQQQNFIKWPIMGQYVWPNPVWFNTYPEEVTYLKNFLTQRIAWMDGQIAQY